MESEKVNNYFYNTKYQRMGKTIGNISELYIDYNKEYKFVLNFDNGDVFYNGKNISLDYITKFLKL